MSDLDVSDRGALDEASWHGNKRGGCRRRRTRSRGRTSAHTRIRAHICALHEATRSAATSPGGSETAVCYRGGSGLKK